MLWLSILKILHEISIFGCSIARCENQIFRSCEVRSDCSVSICKGKSSRKKTTY